MIHADVVVLGDGLAARLFAARCGSSADVVRVGGPSTPRAASFGTLGLAAAGGHDSPTRLVHALGEERARSLWEFSRAATERLVDGTPEPSRGVWRWALHAEEAKEWELSRRLLDRWGEPEHHEASPEDLPPGFTYGVRILADAVVDIDGVLERHRVPSALAGPGRVTSSSDGVIVERAGGEPIHAEVAVIAAGWSSASAHPFFAELLYPVHIQGARYPHVSGSREPGLARHRHEGWAPDGEGLKLIGCRWAHGAELGAGETDDQDLSERVSLAQDRFVRTHLGASGSPIRWAGIEGYSCDGLPLLGPVPGAPRVLALTGWCGWGLSWIAEAVEVVARGLLGEPEERALPPLLHARRMLL